VVSWQVGEMDGSPLRVCETQVLVPCDSELLEERLNLLSMLGSHKQKKLKPIVDLVYGGQGVHQLEPQNIWTITGTTT